MKYFLIIFCICIYSRSSIRAQELQPTVLPKDTFDYFEMSLEQLLNIKAHGVPSELEELINSLISAASKKPLNARETPGIVTLITDEEIRNSGARDLIDVLRLVPGIDFGVDVEGVVGIGTRGLWAHEGKVLLLIDGLEMNENLFATNQFGNHFPVDQIKKIEVVRGPGSAIYGGCAEYGVINIITKGASDFTGIALTGTYGQMKETFGRKNFNLNAGSITKDFQFSAGAFLGAGNRSDQAYQDIYGSSYNMSDSSQLNPSHINLGMNWKGLSFRGILDKYETTVRDKYDAIVPRPYTMNFNTYTGEIKYSGTFGKNKKLTLTPKVVFKKQEPWQSFAGEDSMADEYNKFVYRYTGNITAFYNLTRKINFLAGAEAYSEKAKDFTDSSFFSNGKQEVSYFNQAYFFQSLAKTRFINFILGGRCDIHSEYGSAFVPRIGLTKKFKKFHFKALYSNSFRAPSIENINLGDGIEPELTKVAELEAGYQLTRNSIITANFFDITTTDPIVYFYDDSLGTDNYTNSEFSAGSRGAEVEYRLREKWGYAIGNYSFYSTAGKEKISDYSVPTKFDVLLAFPAHKANLIGWFKTGKYIGISPSLSYIGDRYGYTKVDSLTGNSVSQVFPSVILANLFITATGFVKGLTIGVGCYDILDKKYQFIQPYNGYHAPLPGPSREFVVKIIYESKTKKKKTR